MKKASLHVHSTIFHDTVAQNRFLVKILRGATESDPGMREFVKKGMWVRSRTGVDNLTIMSSISWENPTWNCIINPPAPPPPLGWLPRINSLTGYHFRDIRYHTRGSNFQSSSCTPHGHTTFTATRTALLLLLCSSSLSLILSWLRESLMRVIIIHFTLGRTHSFEIETQSLGPREAQKCPSDRWLIIKGIASRYLSLLCFD